jgi:hypothetical protein
LLAKVSKEAEDIASEILEIGEAIEKIRSPQKSVSSDPMDTENKSQRPGFENQFFIIDEKENYVLLPVDPLNQQCADFSEKFLRLISLINFTDKTFRIEYVNVKDQKLEPKDFDFPISVVDGLLAVYTQAYRTKSYRLSTESLEFLQVFYLKILKDLSVVNFSRERGQNEVKSFYFDLYLMKDTKTVFHPIIQQINRRLFAYSHRLTENLQDDKLFLIINFVKHEKRLSLPKVSKEELTKRCPVISLRQYRRYVLKSEWTSVLKSFSSEIDISLERKIGASLNNRDLQPLFDRLKHNAFYHQNHFDRIKSVLDQRAYDLRWLTEDKKGQKKRDLPSSLDDFFVSYNVTEEQFLNISNPVGMFFASRGLNSKNPPPMSYPLLISSRTGEINFAEKSLRRDYDYIAQNRKRFLAPSLELPTLDEFEKLGDTAINLYNQLFLSVFKRS